MNAIVICPDQLPAGRLFQRKAPLALLPVFGRTLLDRTLEKLSREGYQEVIVLASDRPNEIREELAISSHWGLKVLCVSAERELSMEEAELRFSRSFSVPSEVTSKSLEYWLDLPGGLPGYIHLSNHRFFATLLKLSRITQGIAMEEREPGVWISKRAKVHPTAQINGPAWIGSGVSIAPNAIVDAETIIDSGSVIDKAAYVSASWIGPDTYIGQATEISDSLVWGGSVSRWSDGSFLEINDEFVIADLVRLNRVPRVGVAARLGALLLLGVTVLPVLINALSQMKRGNPFYYFRRVVLPEPGSNGLPEKSIPLRSLSGVQGLAARWPELIEVIVGKMDLVGNRPLTPSELSGMGGSRGALWTSRPAGVFSYADAEGADEKDPVSAVAFAAWYSKNASARIRLSILKNCLVKILSSLAPEGKFSRHIVTQS